MLSDDYDGLDSSYIIVSSLGATPILFLSDC
jgi:hypothetical protein